MQPPQVNVVTSSQRERVLKVLSLAFAADPMMRWVFPQAEDFLELAPQFFDAYGGSAFETGTAFAVGEMQGAALWLPPGVDPDSDRMAELAAGALPEYMLGDAISVMEQMAQFHPDEDCWYLAVIGTDPAHMGTGLGAAMMKHCLRQCDEDGKLAYLESSNPKNVSLYERHGFEALGRIQCGTSPTMTPMLREPR